VIRSSSCTSTPSPRSPGAPARSRIVGAARQSEQQNPAPAPADRSDDLHHRHPPTTSPSIPNPAHTRPVTSNFTMHSAHCGHPSDRRNRPAPTSAASRGHEHSHGQQASSHRVKITNSIRNRGQHEFPDRRHERGRVVAGPSLQMPCTGEPTGRHPHSRCPGCVPILRPTRRRPTCRTRHAPMPMRGLNSRSLPTRSRTLAVSPTAFAGSRRGSLSSPRPSAGTSRHSSALPTHRTTHGEPAQTGHQGFRSLLHLPVALRRRHRPCPSGVCLGAPLLEDRRRS
jgi:hypothetical protein